MGVFSATTAIWSLWRDQTAERWAGRLALLLLGIVIIGLIGMVPVLGPFVLLLATVTGVGAITASLFGARRSASSSHTAV
jgi:hypothetical protein